MAFPAVAFQAEALGDILLRRVVEACHTVVDPRQMVEQSLEKHCSLLRTGLVDLAIVLLKYLSFK